MARRTTIHWRLTLVSLGLALGCGWINATQGGELAVVGFDVPALVVAENVDPTTVSSPLAGGNVIRLRIPVSTYVSTEFRGRVSEYVVEIESPQQTVRVLDFWPRNETYSEIEGNVNVERAHHKEGNLTLQVSGGTAPVAQGSASGSLQQKESVSESYQRRPPMQTLTSSGTIRRGYGAYFKFRPGPTPDLEGSREVALLVEVPQGWRGDLLLVSLRAVGATNNSNQRRLLGHSRMWMTIHQEGDLAAAHQARRFVAQERALRALAASFQKEVQQRALPTVWHKLGAAIDMVDPRIPTDYLQQVLFGPEGQYLEGNSHRLPIELRVAILDFWEQKRAVTQLAHQSVELTLSDAS